MNIYLKSITEHIKILLKWIVVATVVGCICGMVGSAFHFGIDFVTEMRYENLWLIYLLPVGALIITVMYNLFK